MKYGIIIKSSFIFLFGILNIFNIFSQEALKSSEEEYYDFLALQGYSTRSYINYRTLSDSLWKIDNKVAHPWQNLNLGTQHELLNKRIFLRIYGPDIFTSINTSSPYGQNDGALWQGKGFNAGFTAGIRIEGFGFELTFMPQLSFSQNSTFDYMQPAYSGDYYKDKGAIYGYYGIRSLDAPQRFGDNPFFNYDWGNSEIRYSWKTLTLGFGTQAIWLGPAQINPLLLSNNAASFPKFDIGIRKQSIIIPKFNWYIGDIETRAFWGYLSESDFFDNNNDNDHNLITGFTISYELPFLKTLSFGFHRIMLSKFNEMNYASIFTLLWPFMDNSAGEDKNDQRASFSVNYLISTIGLNIYLEWGRNDFSTNPDSTFRYPFHTAVYTFGMRKSVNISKYKGEILLELSNLECSRDYDILIPWNATFYAHHIITQGHTNRGQWIGAGIGTGGNSQYLGFKLYYHKGYGQIFLQRRNPDMDYTWFVDSKNPDEYNAEWNIRAFFDIGLGGLYYITRNISVSGNIVFRDEHNPLYKSKAANDLGSVHRLNGYFSLYVKYSF